MTNADRCRPRAARYAALAERATSEEKRRDYRRLAALWLEMVSPADAGGHVAVSGGFGNAEETRRAPRASMQCLRYSRWKRMRKPGPQPDWPQSWSESYRYDGMEVFGSNSPKPGYAMAYRNRADEALRMVSRFLPVGAKILDIAAGQGNFSLRLAEMGYSVTWNDLREDLVDYVRLKHEFGTIAFQPGNAFELDLPEFDGVLITEVIEHVAHPDEFLTKVAELVKPGGYIFMTTPNGGYLMNRLPRFSDCEDPGVFESMQFKPNADGHIFLLYRDEVLAFADKAGLEVVSYNLFNNPLTSAHMKTSILQPILPTRTVEALERLSRRLPDRLRTRVMAQSSTCFRKPEEHRTSTEGSAPTVAM